MTDPTYYIPLARAVEAAGYHAMTIPDSVAYPYESDSKYPYTPEGSREFLDGKAFIEAFVRAGGQAGRVAGGAVRQPAGARCRHQPVAGGLRADGCAFREARQADGRVHR